MGLSLSRDQILAACDVQTAEVSVPEWGGSVFVRMMSAGERAKFAAGYGAIPRDEIPLRIVALCACDEAGTPLFTEADVAALASKAANPVERVCKAACALNKLDGSDVEDAAKN